MPPSLDDDVADIAVVGAGLTGLALALSLAEVGVQVTIINRREGKPSSDAIRTTTINAASYAFLDKLGMIARLNAAGAGLTPVDKIRVSDDKTRNKSNVKDQLIEWQKDVFGKDDDASPPLAWVFRNHQLEAALHQSCCDHPAITMVNKTVITNFTSRHPQLSDAAAALYTDDGTIHAARLVVAADGHASPIRQAAGLRHISRTPKQIAIVADIATTLPHRNMAWQRFLPRGPAALMPLDDPHLMALVWTLGHDDAAAMLEADDHAFNFALMDSFGDGFGALSLASPRRSWVLRLSHTIKPVATRLVLAGDAAHSIHPLAGQGYNLALGDADCLMRLITEAVMTGTDLGAAAVVTAYSRQRRGEVAAMTIATEGLNAVFSFGGKNLVAMTGMGMALLNATPLKSLAQRLAAGFNRRD
jgi:ubiquinone biosynthesis UbiH/UbiF/VisC/COQ6 family hydroxylase